MKKKLAIYIVILGLILLFAHGLWNTFFQQDEWNGFGTVIALSHEPIQNWFGVLGPYHFIPFSQFFYLILYKLFGFQAEYYAITSLFLHSIASFLVYLFVKRLIKSDTLGFISAILFALNSNTSAAYLNLAVFPATITCFISILLFMLYLSDLPVKHIFSIKDGLILLSLFLLSVGLREDGLLLILFFTLWIILFRREYFNRQNTKFFLFFSIAVSLFFVFRILLQILSPHVISVTGGNYWNIFLTNVLWFAPKIIAQTAISGNYLLTLLLNKLPSVLGTPISLNEILKIFLPTVILAIDCLILLIIAIGFKVSKSDNRRIIIFGLLWVVLYSVLLSAIGRKMDIIEARYLYLPSLGVIISLVVSVYSLKNTFFVKNSYLKLFSYLILGFFLIGFMTLSYKSIQKKIQIGIMQGNARKSILKSLVNLYPSIPKKVVFFVQCDHICFRNSEFGLPNNTILPFSSGPGYIFLLQYAKDKEMAYAPFFKKESNGKEFLWDYGSEGYNEINGYGFGYFIDKSALEKAVKDYHLSSKQIIGIEYDENNFSLRDISNELSQELQKKQHE